MTIAMEGLCAAPPRKQLNRMPPREIVDSTIEQAGVDHEVDRSERPYLAHDAHPGRFRRRCRRGVRRNQRIRAKNVRTAMRQ